jgi:1-deoxy-D-xylulose-5-phosphate reductoisomerase
MAHLGPPDMRHAIGFALNWPDRRHLPVERLDLARLAQLTFRAPDETRYPALRLAREVMAAGGLSGAVFNGAKERALDAFIAGEIGFLDMARVVEEALTEMSGEGHINVDFSLDNVLTVDHLAREAAGRIVGRIRQA